MAMKPYDGLQMFVFAILCAAFIAGLYSIHIAHTIAN